MQNAETIRDATIARWEYLIEKNHSEEIEKLNAMIVDAVRRGEFEIVVDNLSNEVYEYVEHLGYQIGLTEKVWPNAMGINEVSSKKSICWE